MDPKIKTPKKLIEVALPLDDINAAAAREKSIRHGHPSTLHLWWARRPLAAARAVLFSQMVNDPGGERGYYAGKTKAQADAEREELFKIIRELVLWENTNNEEVLEKARAAIQRSWEEACELNKGKPGFDPKILPAFHDPFAGGGAIPLEAQRLGLESHASDLNPVAVLINKAMIEIPPKFSGQPPVGPIPKNDKQKLLHQKWSGGTGLAEDIRRYSHVVRDEALMRIGNLYPKVEITFDMTKKRPDLEGKAGEKCNVIAWLWARTVKSPNPVFSHVDVPLVSSFILSKKKGKEVYVEPIIHGDQYSFRVSNGRPVNFDKLINGTKLSRANFKCILSNSLIDGKYIKAEGAAGRIGTKLMAIVVEGKHKRIYLSPTEGADSISEIATPEWIPSGAVPERLTGGTCYGYGLTEWGKLFTARQLEALTTFSDVILDVRKKVISDAVIAGIDDDGKGIDEGGIGATAYGDAVATYLSFSRDKMADLGNSLVRWEPIAQCPRQLFGRQSIPMIWDFAEPNPFSNSSGSWLGFSDGISKAFAKCFSGVSSNFVGKSTQLDAGNQTTSMGKVISTDPPYYDNIAYADLSDFFYVWLRRSLKGVFPKLFATLAVPKAEELVASAYRHGSKEKAEKFFLEGMSDAIHRLSEQSHPCFPVTIYYAFKQSETKDRNTISTGWKTFLEAVISAGFTVTGTWPMRTENSSRMISQGTNALASSIILACRKRGKNVETISRR
ncbi:MAG: DUF1156 domain-containing protein, partial [Nitrospinae bacterium]|nr:DUF1156 domain-containing protein [Nitrospinota bacterium]